MSPDEIELHLKKISDSIQRQNLSQTQLQSLIATLQQQMSTSKTDSDLSVKMLKNDFDRVKEKVNELASAAVPVIRDLDDIAGVRTPKWYDVNVNFEYGDNTVKFNSIEINPDGPFVITQVTPVWEILDTDPDHFVGAFAPTGRIVPPTAFPMLVNSLGRSNTDPTLGGLFDTAAPGGPLKDIPEFSLQIEIAGSGRYWTNQPVSAAAFYGYFGQPLFLGVQGWVERTDRIVVHVTPTVQVPHTGRLRVSFHGYQILGHVNISDALGY